MEGLRPADAGLTVAARGWPGCQDALAGAWQPPPSRLSLAPHEIHLWRAPLEFPERSLARLAESLSDDERARAERLHPGRVRPHFVAGRAILRAILGRYLDIEPRRVGFSYSPYGKPALAPWQNGAGYTFNLSHSGGVALYAVALHRQVGIDLERVHHNVACDEIARRFFSPLENAVLSALPATIRLTAFFNCWTRKEAYMKGHGEGFSLLLDSFSVSVVPGEPAALLHVEGQPEEPGRWSLYHLAPGDGFVGALAVEGKGWKLRYWQWPTDSLSDSAMPGVPRGARLDR